MYGLGLLAKTDGSNNTSYYLTDGLGSTTDLRDASGNAVESYAYDEWGVPQPAFTSNNPFRFTGQQDDVNANRGLYYLRARFYDPALGRFLSKDPLPLLQRYAYAGDNPVDLIDPIGLCGWRSPWDCGSNAISAVGHAINQSRKDLTSNLSDPGCGSHSRALALLPSWISRASS